MKCPNCESSNIQSHVLVEDKHSRNTKILLITLLIAIAIGFCLNSGKLFGVAVFAVILGIPLCMILKIILAIIPARKKTIFVCNECGTEFELDRSK